METPIIQIPATMAPTDNGPSKNAVIEKDKSKANQAIIFDFFGIARCSSHALMVGPRRGCSLSHRCHLGDDCANAQAAIMRKIVVGINGRNIPSIPNATHIHPKIKK
tara:strand:- start:122 stop:442 length:321 start_codon:yes stop_codon:yes gene_type:complete